MASLCRDRIFSLKLRTISRAKKRQHFLSSQIGMTYTFNTFLFDIGCRYNAHSSINQYYTSETEQHTININNLSTQFRLSWFTDTTKLTRYHPKNAKPKNVTLLLEQAPPSSTWKSTKTNNTDILDLGQNLIIMP